MTLHAIFVSAADVQKAVEAAPDLRNVRLIEIPKGATFSHLETVEDGLIVHYTEQE